MRPGPDHLEDAADGALLDELAGPDRGDAGACDELDRAVVEHLGFVPGGSGPGGPLEEARHCRGSSWYTHFSWAPASTSPLHMP